jgi:hypothetical protein
MTTIKLRRAARMSDLSRYPRTWQALLARIPTDVQATLTARQIASLAGAMHAQYQAGHTAGWQEAQ